MAKKKTETQAKNAVLKAVIKDINSDISRAKAGEVIEMIEEAIECRKMAFRGIKQGQFLWEAYNKLCRLIVDLYDQLPEKQKEETDEGRSLQEAMKVLFGTDNNNT